VGRGFILVGLIELFHCLLRVWASIRAVFLWGVALSSGDLVGDRSWVFLKGLEKALAVCGEEVELVGILQAFWFLRRVGAKGS
jgi:hypothetical protein